MDACTAMSESSLYFSQTWEDPRTDARALRIRPGDTVLGISSAGCTPLSLLAESPSRLISIDANPVQNHLIELKIAALRRLDPERLERFLGRGSRRERDDVFRQIRSELSPEARAYWNTHIDLMRRGPMTAGVMDRFMARVGTILRHCLFSTDRLERFFSARSLQEQREIYDRIFDRPVMRYVRQRLSMLRTGYLPFAWCLPAFFLPQARAHEVPSYLIQRLQRALTEVPVTDNYFLSRFYLGRHLETPEGRPPYLQPRHRDRIAAGIDRIELVSRPIEEALKRLDTSSVDRFQLSNVFEWMPEHALPEVFRELHRVARPGARLFFRNLFNARSVPEALEHRFVADEPLARRLMAEDRSFLYRSMYVLTVVK